MGVLNLTWVEYAHNSLPTSATSMSPFKCVFGYQPPTFSESEPEVSVPSAHALSGLQRNRLLYVKGTELRELQIAAGDRLLSTSLASESGSRPKNCLFRWSCANWLHASSVRSPSPGLSIQRLCVFVCLGPSEYIPHSTSAKLSRSRRVLCFQLPNHPLLPVWSMEGRCTPCWRCVKGARAGNSWWTGWGMDLKNASGFRTVLLWTWILSVTLIKNIQTFQGHLVFGHRGGPIC